MNTMAAKLTCLFLIWHQ